MYFAERAQEFKKSYEEACEKNAPLLSTDAPAAPAEPSEADELAAQVESVKVEDAEESKKDEQE